MATLPLYQGNDWDRLSDNIILDDIMTMYCKAFHVDPEELGASQELSERIGALAFKTERSRDDVFKVADEVAEYYNLPYGVALPSMNCTDESLHDVVLAQGTPLSHNSIINRFTEHAQRLAKRGYTIRNAWEELGDRSVSVVNTNEGPMALWHYHAGNRGRKWIDGLTARMDSPLTAEAEERAVVLLKTKITPSQYRCYLLNNAFPEQSKRSGIFYFFRKGLPVIALSYHGYPEGRIIACLCLHPYGYFEGTHAGVMTPTDEVISQVLLMRANEKKFWGKSGQWSVKDPRSGM